MENQAKTIKQTVHKTRTSLPLFLQNRKRTHHLTTSFAVVFANVAHYVMVINLLTFY